MEMNFIYKDYLVFQNFKGITCIQKLNNSIVQIVAGSAIEAKRVINAITDYPAYDR
jgi:hypothetical protein